MTGTIVAIGGGDLSTLATEPIDRAIIELAVKSKPNVLFVPTASSDSMSFYSPDDWSYIAVTGMGSMRSLRLDCLRFRFRQLNPQAESQGADELVHRLE